MLAVFRTQGSTVSSEFFVSFDLFQSGVEGERFPVATAWRALLKTNKAFDARLVGLRLKVALNPLIRNNGCIVRLFVQSKWSVVE